MLNRVAVLGVLLITGCQQLPAPSITPATQARPAVIAAPPSASPSATAAQTCAEAWQARVRRPSRFTEVVPCATITGTVRATAHEADGDIHIQVLLDPPYQQYLNARNTAAQHGALVMEIEPWEHGARTTAPDPTHVSNHPPSDYCQTACTQIVAGDRLTITSAITTDNEGGHGWNEAHSPSNVQITGHGPAPHGDVQADPTGD